MTPGQGTRAMSLSFQETPVLRHRAGPQVNQRVRVGYFRRRSRLPHPNHMHTHTHTHTHRARTLLRALRDPGVHQPGDRSPLPRLFLLHLAPVLALELKQ